MAREPRDSNVLLSCRGLVIGHGGRPILPPFELALRRGQVLLVAGRNGAGKSTWLKTLLGLIPPVAGRIEAPTPRPRMSYVPQASGFDGLLPVRARTVVSWGRLRGWSFLRPFATRADHDAGARALDQVAARSVAHRPFQELSGGQKQRVLFARLLAGEADVALLDEPTAAMDVPGQRAAYQRIAGLAREHDMAAIVVTHNLASAVGFADELLFFDRLDDATPPARERRGRDDDGAVIVHGPPAEVLAHPRFVRMFGRVAPAAPDERDGAGQRDRDDAPLIAPGHGGEGPPEDAPGHGGASAPGDPRGSARADTRASDDAAAAPEAPAPGGTP